EAWGRMGLVVRSRVDPASLAAAIRRDVHALDPEQPVDDVRTMDEIVHASVAPRRLQARVLGGFAAIALLLAGLGLYRVVSYAASQRTREIAIRGVQGAAP